MKQPIRYFSFGLLSATIVLMVFFLFLEDNQTSMENVPVEALMDAIRAEGYHVVSEDEYISLSVTGKTKNTEEQKEAETISKDEKEPLKDKEEEKEEGKPSIITYTLTVEPGMLGPHISERLAENKIIEEPNKFSRYLEDQGYSRYIQLGEHTLTSDMSYYEIAEKITK